VARPTMWLIFERLFRKEIMHADLPRMLIGGTWATNDPVQTFCFPPGTFQSLANWIDTLEALDVPIGHNFNGNPFLRCHSQCERFGVSRGVRR
jgi:hypothetical protein